MIHSTTAAACDLTDWMPCDYAPVVAQSCPCKHERRHLSQHDTEWFILT